MKTLKKNNIESFGRATGLFEGRCLVFFLLRPEVYHLRSLVKSWKTLPETEVAVNGSCLTWLLRDVFTGRLSCVKRVELSELSSLSFWPLGFLVVLLCV